MELPGIILVCAKDFLMVVSFAIFLQRLIDCFPIAKINENLID